MGRKDQGYTTTGNDDDDGEYLGPFLIKVQVQVAVEVTPMKQQVPGMAIARIAVGKGQIVRFFEMPGTTFTSITTTISVTVLTSFSKLEPKFDFQIFPRLSVPGH